MRAPEHPGDYVERMAGLLERLTTRIETAEARTGQAVTGVEQSVRSALSRIEAAERAQADSAEHIEGEVEGAKAAQAELDERLRKMEDQVAGPRSSEALRALEGAISKIAGQVYEGESRTHDILAEVEARIAKIEEAGPDARLIEEVVSRVGERLSQAESRTHDAIEGLRQSLAALDGRLNSVEDEAGLDSKLEALGARLAGSLDEARAEIAEKFASSADGRYERMERTLDEMSEHVRAAEERSAQAIEQMGREVLNVAEVMNKRIQSAETRNAEAIEKAGGEMARVVQAMETRFTRSDAVHVEALEKLSAEISRITERLGERIASAERRSAQAFDEVGEQVSRVAERINHRAEKASEELAERIRQSEERTARLLDEARDRIGQRLSETQAPGAPARIAQPSSDAAPIALAPAAYEASTFPAREEPEAFSDDPFAGFPEVESSEAPPESASAFMARAFPAAAEKPPTLTAPPAAAEEPEDAPIAAAREEPQPAPPVAADEDAPNPFARLEAALQASEDSTAAFEASDPFAAPAEEPRASEAAMSEQDVFADEGPSAPDFDASFTAEADETQDDGGSFSAGDALFDPPESEPAAAEDSPRPLTTREVVEQARAAARAAAQNGDAKGKLGKPGARNKTASAPLFSGFGISRPKRRAGGTLQTFLMVSGGAAFLGLAAGGVAMMAGKPSGETPPRIAQAKAIAEQDATPVDGPEQDGLAPPPRASVALAPEPMAATEADARMLTPELAAPDLSALYAEAVRALEAGENGALDELKKAANLGHAPAQLYLGKLYEEGRSGVKADLVEARRWTERAAEGGDRRAMHNIALYYFNGEGGPKNPVTAAQWFRRAADLGLVDSQYNLGRLYEEGLGVGQNSAEAYKWYLVAARAGDAEARVAARRVKPSLSVEAQSVAERAAVAFRTTAPAPAGLAASSSPVLTAQRALSKLGYYQGPANGAPTPALRLAITAYQRDQGLAATGTLDNTTVSRLAVFTR